MMFPIIPSLKFIGKIRDPLHDTIAFTAAEKKIIDSSVFQRLRRIQQTAFIKYVFPGATHSRFEHSLGVMHMSGVMLSNLIQNQSHLLDEVDEAIHKLPALMQGSYSLTEQEYGSIRATKDSLQHLKNSSHIAQCMRFAALLHDIGHAPFSHSGERFMPSWGVLEERYQTLEIPDYLKAAFKKKIEKIKKANPQYKQIRVRHEIFTLLIVAHEFKHEEMFLDTAMGQDVCAVIDSAVEPFPGGELEKSGLTTLLHEIVSGELDVDRMDYLLRDSQHCGVVYGLFDAGRVLDSTCFYFDTQHKKFHLALRRRGLPAFEDYLRARWSMYQQVYFHKTATACEAMLENVQKLLGEVHLPLEVEEFVKLDDHTFYGFVESKLAGKNPEILKTLRDLLYDRKLWKRVYEEFSMKSAPSPSLCPAVLNFLRQNKIVCENIESSTSLTRFSPKGRGGKSENILRVVLKDVHGLRFLEPIENHSKLINRTDEDSLIRRIFASCTDSTGAELSPKEIQRQISANIINPANS